MTQGLWPRWKAEVWLKDWNKWLWTETSDSNKQTWDTDASLDELGPEGNNPSGHGKHTDVLLNGLQTFCWMDCRTNIKPNHLFRVDRSIIGCYAPEEFWMTSDGRSSGREGQARLPPPPPRHGSPLEALFLLGNWQNSLQREWAPHKWDVVAHPKHFYYPRVHTLVPPCRPLEGKITTYRNLGKGTWPLLLKILLTSRSSRIRGRNQWIKKTP